MGPRESQRGNAALVHLIAALAVILVARPAAAAPHGADINGPRRLQGLVSIADGGSFTVIRGDDLRLGTKGVTLLTGDIVETGPDAFLVIELQGGSVIGIGPSSGVYLPPLTGAATLVILRGWLKADIRAEAISVLAPRLGIQARQAVVLLHVDEHSDTLFDEQGSGTLLLRDTAATHIDEQTQPNQFFVRQEGSDALRQPRPSADFLAKMPVAFRDTLPQETSARPGSPLEPKRVRKVTYSDIQTWLALPRDWRAGFITRFRRRLEDPAFFAAMDAHRASYPEWIPILHPKQNSEAR